MKFSIKTGAVGALLLVMLWAFWTSVYRVDATEVAVFQAPFTGHLSVESAPGTYFRMWSSVRDYKKQDNYSFEWSKDKSDDRSIPVQFNDGGKAQIGGNIQWEMPQDQKHVLALHVLFGSQEGVDQSLMRNAINRAMIFTAPLMSATDSYAARRAEFLFMFADQLTNGIYETESITVRKPDPITGEVKDIKQVRIVRDEKGQPLRAEASPLKKYGIQIQPPTITHIIYEPKVEAQIQQQRDNILAIQTAQAEAKKAEQAAITAAKNGEAQAMQAKWEQEVVKAKAVTKAEQQKQVAEIEAAREKSVQETNAQRDLDVQTLKAKTAEQYKMEQTLIGEGDGARKRAVMQADGALAQKLQAWTTAQKYWADAFSKYRGQVVPSVVTGGTGEAQGNAAMNLMQLMGIKAAKDLALDLSIQSQQAKR